MADWVEKISEVMDEANSVLDGVKQQINRTLGLQDPLKIQPYRGYGTQNWLYLKGRVLQDEGIEPLTQDAPVRKNVLNMYRRFESDEIPYAQVRVRVGQAEQIVAANEEGFFETLFDLEDAIASSSLWQTVHFQLLEPLPSRQSVVTAIGEAIVVSDTAQFGIISDMDDTVVYTAATDPIEMIQITYLGNEHSRRPFKGVASFYQALQRGRKDEGNPIFYVSSSPWNMYDLFEKFMALNAIPNGPILLNDIELSPDNLLSFEHQSHKREQIDPILKRFSDLPFILIGDSGQQDAEIYSQIVKEYPDRILGVYIRDVLPDDEQRQQELSQIAEQVRAAGVAFVIFSETVTAAKHAEDQGWTTQTSLTAVQVDRDY